MAFDQSMPEQRITDAAVILGECVKEEQGRCGLRIYLSALGEIFPREWIEEVAKRLELPQAPLPMPRQNRPETTPESQRNKRTDMEKVMQLMQVMGNPRT